jgi:spore germination cell wall hydrolase CwlJ-like protein
MAVAFVTLNRVKSDRFPDSFCEVVWQRGQFEWTEDNKPDTPLEIESYEEIKRLSHSFLSNHEYYNDPTRGSLFYHASYVKPCWLPDSELTVKIGVHNFYHVNSKGVSCWNERGLAAR